VYQSNKTPHHIYISVQFIPSHIHHIPLFS
jgi:hypothetical protein